MATTFYLSCRVRRTGGVRVLVPLLPDDETLFLEDGDAPPEGVLLLDAEIERGTRDEDERVLSLQEVGHTLWPAGFASIDERLEETRNTDNRLDMEERLQSWADLFCALLAWWRGIDTGLRAHRLAVLSAHAPRLASLLQVEPPAEAIERGAHRDTPPWNWFEELFLAPTESRPPGDEAAWEAWKARGSRDMLDVGGGLALLMGEDFELREGQVEMALRIEAVLDKHEHLMVEAGTGIGKSIAYLVPAMLHGAVHEERTVVSTYTKALQSQLIDGDLPMLERFGYPGTVRLLLGRNNYLCARQKRRAEMRAPDSRDDALAQIALLLWCRQSAEGRREELSDHPAFGRHWRALFESVEPCSPHICHRDPPCFVVRARRLAREAHVVVVNHSLLMMDLKSSQGLLGPSRLLVVDEAHELPQVATNALSIWIRRDRLEVYRNLTGERPPGGGLREVLADVLRAGSASHDRDVLRQRCEETDRALDAYLNAFASWFSQFESGCELRLASSSHRAGRHRIHDGDEAFAPSRGELDRLLERGDALDKSLARVLDISGDALEMTNELEEEREALASLLQFHREQIENIRFCVAADDEDWVYWVEWRGSEGLAAIVAAPLTVGEPLAELWDQHYRSVIMTSATLAVGEDFTPFAEAVGFGGVSRYTDSLLVSSPFRYEEQALVLTTPELIDPKEPVFPAMIARLLASICFSVSTKTLVLCTSYQLVDGIHDELESLRTGESEDLFHPRTHRVEPVLLRQTPGGSRDRLAAAFREAEAAVLMATGSFWEGVDFPGRQLEVLVVPRLPFAVPTEPLTEGRYERAKRMGRDPFQEVALADAVLRLKQGVGRLLRTREDRGAVLLLDQRLQAKSYGVVFLNSMPRHCEWVPTRDELAQRVVDFLDREDVEARQGRAG